MNPIEALAWLFGMATMFSIIAMVTFTILFDELKDDQTNNKGL